MWLPRFIRRIATRRRREIFHYRDGLRQRRIDPLVAWRRMQADHELDPSIHFPQLAHADPKLSDEAMAIVASASRRIFGLTSLDDSPEGVTEREAVEVLVDFINWGEALKKNTNTPPISSQLMDSASSAA